MLTYNILVMGATGAGKSTTINALANFITLSSPSSDSFDQLLSHGPCPMVVVPESVTGQCPVSQTPAGYCFDYLAQEDTDDKGEKMKKGAKATTPIKYRVRLIDTPDLGQPGGPAVDRVSFDHTLAYLGQLEAGLCSVILVLDGRQDPEQEDPRQWLHYRYCLTELLTHLPRVIINDHLVFLFTHSRASHFAPGPGYRALERFLATEVPKFSGLKVGTNCFFLDNEPFGYLMTTHRGTAKPRGQKPSQTVEHSWAASLEQVRAMFGRVLRLVPCQLKDAPQRIHQLRMYFRQEEFYRTQPHLCHHFAIMLCEMLYHTHNRFLPDYLRLIMMVQSNSDSASGNTASLAELERLEREHQAEVVRFQELLKRKLGDGQGLWDTIMTTLNTAIMTVGGTVALPEGFTPLDQVVWSSAPFLSYSQSKEQSATAAAQAQTENEDDDNHHIEKDDTTINNFVWHTLEEIRIAKENPPRKPDDGPSCVLS